MRWTSFIIVFASFLGGLTSCGVDYPPGTYHIELRDTTFTTGAGHRQVYWRLQDSAGWEEVLASVDTTYQEPGYKKIRSKGIWYEFWESDHGLRARQPYPGWERAFDSTSRNANILFTEDFERVLVDIPSADVLLGTDSVRIGIVHVTGRAFDWQRFPLNYPDYLLLTLPGNRGTQIVLDQDNIGPISRQTVFRVGRRKYALKFVSEDRREIIVEELTNDRDLALTAELDINYRQIQVKTLTGEETYLKRTQDKELIIYFCSLWDKGATIQKIDSLYQAMPPGERAELELALILRNNTPESAQTFRDTSQLSLPLYLSTAKTCLRLNCRPYSHYTVSVDKKGRITSYFNYHRWLVDRLGGEGGDRLID